MSAVVELQTLLLLLATGRQALNLMNRGWAGSTNFLFLTRLNQLGSPSCPVDAAFKVIIKVGLTGV